MPKNPKRSSRPDARSSHSSAPRKPRPESSSPRTPQTPVGQRQAAPPPPAHKDWVSWVRQENGKQAALKAFWEAHRLPDRPPRILSSEELDRVPADSTFGLFFHPLKKELHLRRTTDLEGLFIEEHQRLSDQILEQLRKPHLVRACKSLIAIHLRAGNGVHFLFLQVKPESPNTWRELNKLSEWVQRTLPEIAGMWLIHDGPSHPLYWGELGGAHLRKVFGPESLHEGEGENRYFFHPLDKVDLDRKLLPTTSEVALQLLKPRAESKVLCLSTGCSYPILELARTVANVEIFDPRALARETYARNRERHGWKNVRFHKFDEGKDYEKLPSADLIWSSSYKPLVTSQVEALIRTGAKRVARRFHSPLELEKEWSKWKKQGWMLLRLKVLDPNPLRPESIDVWAVFQGEAERRFADGQAARKVRPEKSAGPVFVQR